MGSLDFRTGQLNIVVKTRTPLLPKTLTFGSGSLTAINGLSRTATATSAITFSGATACANARISIIFTGQATTAIDQIIGPWAIFGTTAASQTDYASYNRTAGGAENTFGIQGAVIASTTQTAKTSATNTYTNNTAAITLTANHTIVALVLQLLFIELTHAKDYGEGFLMSGRLTAATLGDYCIGGKQGYS